MIVSVFRFFEEERPQPMPRFQVVVLCSISLLASPAHCQSPIIAPFRVASGTVLEFHLQTRLHPTAGDALGALPKGTILQVKMLDSLDSGVDRDGAAFHGSLATPLVLEGQVVIRAEAEVRGLLVLLRSRTHPEGFRYELLITGITDHGKSHDLTASLNPSFIDPGPQPTSDPKAATK
jgi:hypothetical protein